MPLLHDPSDESLSKNIETLIKEGKGKAQATAIAYKIKRESKNNGMNNRKARAMRWAEKVGKIKGENKHKSIKELDDMIEGFDGFNEEMI